MSTALKATEIVGRCRGRWSWNNRVFTAQGVEVPRSVMAEDEVRFNNNLDIGPDEQVLDMRVTLPVEALPAGAELVPIDEVAAAEAARPRNKTTTEVDALNAELASQREELEALKKKMAEDAAAHAATKAELDSTKADLDAATKPADVAPASNQ